MANKIKVTDEMRQAIGAKVKSGMRPKDIYAGYKDQFSLATFNNILKKLREDANKEDDEPTKQGELFVMSETGEPAFIASTVKEESFEIKPCASTVDHKSAIDALMKETAPLRPDWRHVGLLNIGSQHSTKVQLWVQESTKSFIAQCLHPTNKIKGYSYGTINLDTYKIITELGIAGSWNDAEYLIEYHSQK